MDFTFDDNMVVDAIFFYFKSSSGHQLNVLVASNLNNYII
jgi:hypothetical protein